MGLFSGLIRCGGRTFTTEEIRKMTTTFATTIRDIVAEDYRAAAVFQKYNIDFCCGGKRPLEEACREQGLDVAAVKTDLARACSADQPGAPRFSSWDPQMLVAYIVGNHHAYVRDTLPVLLAHTQKIASVHGERRPELNEVAALFAAVNDEMTSHMYKEEAILFPYIVRMASAVAEGRAVPPAPFGTVDNPIRMMEAEHESAGGAMARIRELTNDYAVVDEDCMTFRSCMAELRAFEQDLHAHVHLENNILFPKAQQIEATAR
jgi:regulator of cell morphogenesis and NO signaling